MIIGWDVSTSAIGICAREDDGKLIKFHVIFPKGNTALEKWRSAHQQISDWISLNAKPWNTHVVEERLGGFTGGLTTKQTLMALAAMNAVVSHLLSSSGDVLFIAPITTKRITGLQVPKGGDKKAEVIKLVRSREPSFPYAETAAGNYVKGTDDMADAWLLAEAALKVKRGEATLGQPKKATRRKGKAGGTPVDSSPKGGVRLRVPRKARLRSVPELKDGEG